MTSDAKLNSGTSHTDTPQHLQHPLAASSSQAVSFLSNKCHASTSLLVALLPGQLAFAPPTLLLLIWMMMMTMTKMMMIACCKMTFPLPSHRNIPPTLTHHPRPHSLTLILERAGARRDNKEQDEGEEGDEHLGLVVVGVGSADSLHAVVRARGN